MEGARSARKRGQTDGALVVAPVGEGGTAHSPYGVGLKRAARGSAAGAGGGMGLTMPHHDVVSNFVRDVATPEQVSLLSRLVRHLEHSGMPFVKSLIESHPDDGVECALEHGFCDRNPKCKRKDGTYLIFFGVKGKAHESRVWRDREMPASCNVGHYHNRDPVPIAVKHCWMDCPRRKLEIERTGQCLRGAELDRDPGFVTRWAKFPDGCGGNPSSSHETTRTRALALFCEDADYKKGLQHWLDCRYANAYAAATGAGPGWDGVPDAENWIDRAWMTFFKGEATGMKHSMMVTNLIRSVNFFSRYPIVVFCVDTPEVSPDWDPAVFPRLIIVHVDGLEQTMVGARGGISFNFNKFRAMMLLRIKVGVQVDADMVVGANCDRLFDATEREVALATNC